MASAPSMSVNLRRLLSRGEGSGGGGKGGRFECSAVSCAWKAPRALTGSLASTSLPHCSPGRCLWRPTTTTTTTGSGCGRNIAPRRYEGLNHGKLNYRETADFAVSGRNNLPCIYLVSDRMSKLCCSSSSEPSSAISPESLWEDLKPTISYLAPEELKLVNDALKLAFEAHDGQKRRSGEPYIIHPVQVARILGELELDWESVAAGLLHDTVEDTNVTFEQIEKEFGVTVRQIVEGETKVSKLGKLQCKDCDISVQDVKADDLRQMFLAMTEEVRVIIVKLADRLHNMRTLSHMPQHKQCSIALETLQVFAPLAKLLGMYQIKSELEYLSFMYTNAHDFGELKMRVEDLYKEHEKELLEATKILRQRILEDQFLELLTVKTEVHSVCKDLFSIYKGMRKSKSSIKEVNQIAQLRIIIKPKTCIGVGPLCNAQQICYHVLGIVHGIWTPIPRAMKDYIATPKPNGYQSLQTTVIPFLYESMFRLEVQIRTEDMDLIAERGIAAQYSGRGIVSGMVEHGKPTGRSHKGKAICLNNTDIALRIGWLNAIREWQEEFVGNMSSREFVDIVMRDLLGSRVFVYTPKGEIKNLPMGATVIDYSYLIHTEIGNKMVAAKVNGNLVSPMHVLANAEVVEIITYDALSSKSAFQRHQQWLHHAKTRSARHKIMKFLREQAVLSATEITADTVNNFVSDLKEENEYERTHSSFSKERKSIWDKTLTSFEELSSTSWSHGDLMHVQNTDGIPKLNGKHNKSVQKMSLKINGNSTIRGDNLTEILHTGISMYMEDSPGLESWKAGKVSSWHSLEGHPVQWFCVVCIDRRGIMAEVSSALTAVGIMICSCVADVDRRKGMGVMLFHIEGSDENLVALCCFFFFDRIHICCCCLIQQGILAVLPSISDTHCEVPELREDNFKIWKERVLLQLWCMDIDYAKDEPPNITNTSTHAQILLYELWEKSNRLSVMYIKTKVSAGIRG